MIEYKDPIPPVISLLAPALKGETSVYGNTFPDNVTLPALLVRQAGGNDYYRIQFLARARTDIEAMEVLINAMNFFERNGQYMLGLRVKWIARESNPIPGVDDDSGIPEAWCYMRVEALETY